MDNRSGKLGEQYVADELEKGGCRILCRNYHSRFGEIDIIAQDGSFLLFVEVKTRGRHCLGVPQEAVSTAKQRKIISAALQYLSQNETNLQPRFDVAVVRIIGERPTFSLEYIENAFEAQGRFA